MSGKIPCGPASLRSKLDTFYSGTGICLSGNHRISIIIGTCSAKTPSTGNHPCNNALQIPRRILLISEVGRSFQEPQSVTAPQRIV